MNVLMVCPEFPPDAIGGGGEVFRALARRIPRDGVRLDVACANWRGTAYERREGAAYVYEIPLIRTPSRTPYLRTTLPPTLGGLARLRRTMDSERYDLAHLHGVSFALVDIAAHMLRRRKIPWIFTLHGAPRTPYRLAAPLRAAYSAYARSYGSLGMRHAALRTSVSSGARCFASIARVMRDARVIPNGVDAAEYAGGLPEREIPGWPLGREVLLSLGRLEPAKGFDTALRALAASRRTDAVYVVLGEDYGEGRELERLARDLGLEERFFMLGFADLAQKRFAFRRTNVLVVPSWNESFGLVALEGMAAGVPVVASDVEGLRDVFAGGLEYLLVAPRDPRALANRIDEVLSSADDPEARAARLVARAQSYSWDAVAERYVACYREALASTRR